MLTSPLRFSEEVEVRSAPRRRPTGPVTTIAFVLAVVTLIAPLAAEAQRPAKVPRLGILLFGTPTTDPGVKPFREGMHRLGYVEGQNIIVEYRYADGRPDGFLTSRLSW